MKEFTKKQLEQILWINETIRLELLSIKNNVNQKYWFEYETAERNLLNIKILKDMKQEIMSTPNKTFNNLEFEYFNRVMKYIKENKHRVLKFDLLKE